VVDTLTVPQWKMRPADRLQGKSSFGWIVCSKAGSAKPDPIMKAHLSRIYVESKSMATMRRFLRLQIVLAHNMKSSALTLLPK
jgi:hypothetical protein